MKNLVKKLGFLALAAIIGFLPVAASTSPAHALPLTQQAPSWVMPGAYFDCDFENKRFYNCPVWQGTGNSPNGYRPSIFYYVNFGNPANLYMVQWKDGILRPSGPSSLTNMPRISDYGLWNEGGPNNSTNYVLQNRDFTNASWTKSNMTTTKTGIVGADNTTGNATQLTATGVNATALQTIAFNGKINLFGPASTVVSGGTGYAVNNVLTVSGGTCTTQPQLTVASVSGGVITAVTDTTAGSCTVLPSDPVSVTGGAGTGATFNLDWRKGTTSAWLKCVTCTGAISLTMDNGGTWTDISSTLLTTKFLQVRIPTQNLLNNTVGIRISNNSDVIVADFFQTEDDDIATTPMWTTTATIRRGSENVFIGTNASNFNFGWQLLNNTQQSTPFTYLFQYSGNFSSLYSHANMVTDTPFISSATSAGVVNGSISGVSITTSPDTDTNGLFTRNKAIMRFDKFGAAICVNGQTVKTASTPTNATSLAGGTHANLQNNGSNAYGTNGYMARWTGWRRAVSNGEMQQYSTVINNQ